MKKFFVVFFKLLRYIVLVGLIAYALFNSTARKLVLGEIQIHSLKANIKEAKEVNLEYKKRLYYLETKPDYMDRIVKEELEVLSEDEIEYRFANEKTTTTDEKVKG